MVWNPQEEQVWHLLEVEAWPKWVVEEVSKMPKMEAELGPYLKEAEAVCSAQVEELLPKVEEAAG